MRHRLVLGFFWGVTATLLLAVVLFALR